jgi:nitric oxide dioxygenase
MLRLDGACGPPGSIVPKPGAGPVMDLSDEELDVVRSSFREIAIDPRASAGLFYDRLFELEPELRRMFPPDMEQQGAKMMSMLGAIVARIHDHAALLPMVGDLARRHAGYGALPAHYARVGEALLWTLEQRLGARCTEGVRDAWRKAYAGLAAAMTAAAARAA